MTTNRALAVLLLGSLLPATLPAAPTAVEFQGVTIGSKLKTTPVDFKTKVGLAGGGFLAPGAYDVEVASTGDKSRVMLLFFQKGVKKGETPGVLKLGPGRAGIVRPNCNAALVCNAKGSKSGFNCDGAKGSKGIIICKTEGSEGALVCNAKGSKVALCTNEGASQGAARSRYLSFAQLGFTGGVKPGLRASVGGATLLTIPGAGGASVEAELPAAH